MKKVQRKIQDLRQKTGNRKLLTEGIIPLKKNGHRDWEYLNDEKLVSFAKKFLKEKGISGRSELQNADHGLYDVLRKRGVLDQVGLNNMNREHRYWASINNEKVVECAKTFIKEKGISGRWELQKTDPGLYHVLKKRGLLDKIGFKEKRQRRPWKKMKDQIIIEHAKRFMEENGIRRRKELEKADHGLFSVLRRRGLLNKLGFEEKIRKERFWKQMKDEDIIERARRFMKENRINGRGKLSKADPGLYSVLKRRGLLDKVGFEEKQKKSRPWKKMNNKELIEHAKSFMKENEIIRRSGLQKADKGLYSVLWRRGLWDMVGFGEKTRKRRPWKKMRDEEIIAYAKRCIEENGITGRLELQKADPGLYDTLRKRKLLDQVFFHIEQSQSEKAIEQIIDFTASFGERR